MLQSGQTYFLHETQSIYGLRRNTQNLDVFCDWRISNYASRKERDGKNYLPQMRSLDIINYQNLMSTKINCEAKVQNACAFALVLCTKTKWTQILDNVLEFFVFCPKSEVWITVSLTTSPTCVRELLKLFCVQRTVSGVSSCTAGKTAISLQLQNLQRCAFYHRIPLKESSAVRRILFVSCSNDQAFVGAQNTTSTLRHWPWDTNCKTLILNSLIWKKQHSVLASPKWMPKSASVRYTIKWTGEQQTFLPNMCTSTRLHKGKSTLGRLQLMYDVHRRWQ